MSVAMMKGMDILGKWGYLIIIGVIGIVVMNPDVMYMAGDAIQTAISAVIGFYENMFDWIFNGMTGIFGKLTDGLSYFFSKMVDMATSIFDGITGLFTSIFDTISNGIKDLWDRITDVDVPYV